mgnify:FL=1
MIICIQWFLYVLGFPPCLNIFHISLMNRAFILLVWMFMAFGVSAQTGAERMAAYEQQKFCSNLNKVLESGRQEDFESLTDMNERQSSVLPVPGYSIRLAPFDVVYVDKDRRFVGKTNENLDSLSAVKRLEQLKPLVANCLDSTWRWSEALGDDSTTVFFKEFKQLRAMGPEFTISLAMDVVAHNLYTVNLYIRKNRRK